MSRFFDRPVDSSADSHACAPSPRDNPCANPSLDHVIAQRRQALGRLGGLAAMTALTPLGAALSGCATPGTSASSPTAPGPLQASGAPRAFGFRSIPASSDDRLVVPEGYTAQVLLAWGDPIGDSRGAPAFRFDAGNSAEDQALQAGMHHDGMAFFPLPWGPAAGRAAQPAPGAASDSGLLAMNHEYPDHGLLFPDGDAAWSPAKVRKSQAAVGVGVLEVKRAQDGWTVVRPSRYARRIHANTAMRLSGPAAGHPWMCTERSPNGRAAFGTFANCANGWTPWGTYLTCEENFHMAFRGREQPTPDELRYGITRRSDRLRWAAFDSRFDVERQPNEPHHFGWVVEIDPFDPARPPVKRTALGRKKQEGAAPAIAADGRVAFYMGDDQPFEYLYKFVTARPWNPVDRAANRDLLDDGVLYVARFDADGTGRWIALVHGQGGLTAQAGFGSQAEVVIRARAAADVVGATPLDRPEWTAVDAARGDVYVALTNNVARGVPGRPGTDAANPRAINRHGHLLRFSEAGGDAAATTFGWEVFAIGGEDQSADSRGIRGDVYSGPDGLLVDGRGMLWVQTDQAASAMTPAERERHGNNQMLAVDPVTRETRRFLTGPRGCEITGACMTPDGSTMFVNIQHPGEGRKAGEPPTAVSNWPDQRAGGRPRSATVAIRRLSGGVIGAP